MNVQADKAPERRHQSVGDEVSQHRTGDGPAFQFDDNRPQAMAHQRIQAMADNGPRSKQAAQLQAMADRFSSKQQHAVQKKANNTGLPDHLKSGIENLSGHSMDDVKVHYNSDKPAQLHAHAYAQGADIHLGSGQEKHLPHEAWHVVQQKQGLVKPTMQMKDGTKINQDAGLEKEADAMGDKAVQTSAGKEPPTQAIKAIHSSTNNAAQLVWNKDGDTYLWDKLLDGVAWFSDEEGQMWFHISDAELVSKGDIAEYRKLEGQKKTHPEWNAISIEPQPDLAPHQEEEAPGVHLVVDAPKGGNDKQWFPHPSEPIGWLQARDEGKISAVQREVATIRLLAGLGIPVATIIDRAPPASITISGVPKTVYSPGGVWLSQVNSVATKKPKILGHPLAGASQTATLVKSLKQRVTDLPALIGSLQGLLPHLDVLCKYVGEVDLAFTPSGQVVVMDVAPADGGQVVEQEDGAVATIREGIERLIRALG